MSFLSDFSFQFSYNILEYTQVLKKCFSKFNHVYNFDKLLEANCWIVTTLRILQGKG